MWIMLEKLYTVMLHYLWKVVPMYEPVSLLCLASQPCCFFFVSGDGARRKCPWHSRIHLLCHVTPIPPALKPGVFSSLSQIKTLLFISYTVNSTTIITPILTWSNLLIVKKNFNEQNFRLIQYHICSVGLCSVYQWSVFSSSMFHKNNT